MTNAIFDESHDTFRNELASVHADGRRKWVYARQPHGRYYRARTWVSAALLAFLFSAPFIEFRGEPLVLLNVLERRFVFFGLVFSPQDFSVVVLVALTALVTLALVTTAVGRIWCGWLCPQTIFMEMVFRRIEYVIDGSAAQQVRRDGRPWTFDTVWRRVVKHAIFFGLSFTIANLFLSYIIGWRALATIVTDPPQAHLIGLIAITVFSLLFYGVFARFREQVCTLACPYGRVMSALIDRYSVTVTYDSRRGEPRGHHTRGGGQSSSRRGDCIDCSQCVTVCPTGIDIRNGIQLECINCTACMDACDDVMRRVGKSPGLVRLTSHDTVHNHTARWLTTRVKAYAVVWLILLASVATTFAMRSEVDVVILRQPGTLYAAAENGQGANFYNVQVVNRTGRPRHLEFRVTSPANATVSLLGPLSEIQPHGLVESRLLVRVPVTALTGPSTPIQFEVLLDQLPLATIDSAFLGPTRAEDRDRGGRLPSGGSERIDR